MPVLRTTDLAKAAQISVQQVRNYEASGLIPPAERSPSRYRLYTSKHLAALKSVRSLIHAYGWPQARSIMQAVHNGMLPAAMALIDRYHAEFAARRLQLEYTLDALGTLAAQSTSHAVTRQSRSLRVGEAARLVGVRVSAVHFWEEQGLLHPERDKSSRYRLYNESEMRRLRVVALLREAGYSFPAIHTALDELAAGRPRRAIDAVEKRRAELAATSWRCLSALTEFHAYVTAYWPELYKAIADMNALPAQQNGVAGNPSILAV